MAVLGSLLISIQVVVYGMAGAMAVAFIVALLRMPAGKVEESVDEIDATR